MTRAAMPEPAWPIEPLGAADLDEALELSIAAQWNQNADDWRLMLASGRGFGIRAHDGDAHAGRRRLVASVLVLPYGERFGWISMMLVLPAWRRRGLASALMRHAVANLQADRRYAVLDATPAGREVYLREGFADGWRFARYRREASSPAVSSKEVAAATEDATIRPLRESDWSAVEALDTTAFGARRAALLRALFARWPSAAQVLVGDDSVVRGFVLGRDGRQARQLGPLVADDVHGARVLLASALYSTDVAVYLDLLESRAAELSPWLRQRGFVLQRQFTRMVRGASGAPGDPTRLWAVAGPELG